MKVAGQFLDGIRGALVRRLGQLGIECGRRGAAVTEQSLNVAQAESLLVQMGGKAVTQRVGRDLFFIPQSASIRRIAFGSPSLAVAAEF